MLNIVVKPHRSYLRANTSEPQKLFVMLRLIPERQVAQTRPPIAIALVIDTSGSMREETNNVVKLEQAIKAAHKFIDAPQLQEGDKLCIIQFDSTSEVLLPLSPLDRDKAHRVVETLRNYDGGTEMGRGMQNA
ncbi:MAG: VWA domain-containing protein, partial [bacterium]